MTPQQDGRGCCGKRRGRPRVARMIDDEGQFRCFAPLCGNRTVHEEQILLLPEELEVLRLVDLLGFDQEAAAATIGISRKTLWRDLHEARRKIADALVYGKTIRVLGCLRRDAEDCPSDIQTE
ncbi:DUF134 domain-containing protein [Methanocalculus taiwanensis]|uniref:UPF0251 protein FTO68_06640 n=1 Tax=Methanocalculus taiwanensis TaxID=106207 RepID=A0ABD4TLF5_9EURY|nr:DUF134 domain-containing protein [Methanocalculus taiwanensis]MCQ1538660.1 DUF134 domain-containing protein [Methanocalculus taiwanensis]